MKKLSALLLILSISLLVACQTAAPSPTDHSHIAFDGNNIVEHEQVGYCGNTITTVSCNTGGKPWEKSFWGSESIALTDLLRYLDYSDDACKCLPEYTVTTEFGDSYGVSLSQGYARYGSRQTRLTSAQLEQVREIMDWAAKQ